MVDGHSEGIAPARNRNAPSRLLGIYREYIEPARVVQLVHPNGAQLANDRWCPVAASVTSMEWLVINIFTAFLAPGLFAARKSTATAKQPTRRGEAKAMPTAVAGKGLEGIVAANSGICWIDGEAGVLSYRGIDIHELAEHSTFEETTYLLWNGILPNELALREF